MDNIELLPSRDQAACKMEPFHRWSLPDGTCWTEFYRSPAGYLLRFPGLADFTVSADGCSCDCVPSPGVSEATIDHLLLNQVLPLALSKRGKMVFHGSAVEGPNGAIAFLGVSGRGKSTLAASLTVNGHRFLTDDGLVLEYVDDRYMVQPSHPSLRLWEDSQTQLLGEGADVAPRIDYPSKARLLAGPTLGHCAEPQVMRAAYFLGDGSATEIEIERLTEAESVVAWAAQSFLIDLEDRSLMKSHFHRIAALANTRPCYRLDYPRRYEDLSRVIRAVLAHACSQN